MNFNKQMWDLQASILFSMTISITDPIYSVNSLKIIGMLFISLSLKFEDNLFSPDYIFLARIVHLTE